MATKNQFSLAAFAAYGNRMANTNTPFQQGVKTFLKKEIERSGYPSCKAELSVIDERTDIDVSPILDQVPTLVSGFMHDEQRAFELPAPDKKTCPATIKVVAKHAESKPGGVQFGDRKGQSYSTTVDAHEEVVVKNNRKAFKHE